MSAAARNNDPDSVRRNPQDILGIEFSQYKQKVYTASVTSPALYFKTRENMEDILKKKLISSMYDTVYDLLRYGIVDDKPITINDIPPNYPSNLVNSECMKIVATFDQIINDIIEIIHPSSYEALALDRMRIKAAGTNINA